MIRMHDGPCVNKTHGLCLELKPDLYSILLAKYSDTEESLKHRKFVQYLIMFLYTKVAKT